jgi:hypothetical protein
VLKNKNKFSLTALMPEVQNQGSVRNVLPLQALKENLSLPVGIPRLYGSITPVSASIFI